MAGDVWVLKGSGQILENVHTEGQCAGHFCTIHHPAPGPWDDWEMRLIGNRVMCRICPCGVAHPAVEDIINGLTHGLHSCCGVCQCGVSFIDWDGGRDRDAQKP